MTADDIGAAIVYLNCKAAGPDIAGAGKSAAGSAAGSLGQVTVSTSLGHPGHRIEWSTFLAVRLVDLQLVFE